MAKSYDEFLQEAHQVCDDLAPYVGAVTGQVYGAAAGTLTQSPIVGLGVEAVIGGFVGDHWTAVCDLPANLQNALADAHAPAMESNSPAGSEPDNSMGPGD